MVFPEELKYTHDHEWIKITGSEASIGITDFAQRELGDIVYVETQITGAEIAKNNVFGSVEAVKTVSDLFMPITGVITEMNQKLESEPEVVNQDPYGDGWMVKINIADRSELDSLLSASEYKSIIGVY